MTELKKPCPLELNSERNTDLLLPEITPPVTVFISGIWPIDFNDKKLNLVREKSAYIIKNQRKF